MNKPLIIVSVVFLVLTVALEAGASWVGIALASLRSESSPSPTGLAIPLTAALDVALLVRVCLTAFGNTISGWLQGKLDGLITIFTGIGLLIAGFAGALGAFALLQLMLGLFLAVPFGTAVYMALFGAFSRAEANALTGLALLFKIVGLLFFVLWNVRVIKSKGIVLLAACCLLGTALVSLLHGLVPGVLVSITDAIGAICVGVICLIWGIVLLVVGVLALLRALGTTLS